MHLQVQAGLSDSKENIHRRAESSQERDVCCFQRESSDHDLVIFISRYRAQITHSLSSNSWAHSSLCRHCKSGVSSRNKCKQMHTHVTYVNLCKQSETNLYCVGIFSSDSLHIWIYECSQQRTYRFEEFDLIHRRLCVMFCALHYLHCNKPLHPVTTEKGTFANRKQQYMSPHKIKGVR